MARRHFESGVAYLQESDYENALRAFQKAYDLSHRPAILINIATVHERRGDARAAIGALEGYLEAEPEGEHAEMARLRIQNLEKRVAEQTATEPPPAQAAPPPESARATPAPSPVPAPAAAEPARPDRLPAYVALGLGGLAGAGALVTGLMAQSEYGDLEDSCSPGCSDDDVSGTRTLAWVSTGLTGGAIVGIGIGIALLAVGGESEGPASSARPELDLAIAPSGSSARATFRF